MDSDEQSDKDLKSSRAGKGPQKNNKRRRGDDDEEYNPDREEANARKAKKKVRKLLWFDNISYIHKKRVNNIISASNRFLSINFQAAWMC